MRRIVEQRGSRRLVVLDLIVGVGIVSLPMAALGTLLKLELTHAELAIAIVAFGGPLVLAVVYGWVNAAESRRGWLRSSLGATLLYLTLILVSIIGLAMLTTISPLVAVLLIASESLVLFWSSSWV